jgi:hypothetical protein
MIDPKQKINPYLAIVLILMTGLVFTLLIWSSINQPSGLDINRTAANIQQ